MTNYIKYNLKDYFQFQLRLIFNEKYGVIETYKELNISFVYFLNIKYGFLKSLFSVHLMI